MRHPSLTPERLARPRTVRVVVALMVAAGVAALAGAGPQAAAAQKPAARAVSAASPGIESILKELAGWNGGIESAAVWKLRDYVYSRKDDAAGRAECEAKLLAFLKAPATIPARITAARYLRMVAGDTAVPALQALLADERASDFALYVLQRLDGPAADKALVQALATPAVQTKVSILAALGERRTAAAVPAIVPLLKMPALAAQAATSLGAIGGDAASQALAGALPGAAGEVKTAIAGALLRCAERMVASKNDAAAAKIYDTLFADASLPASARRAAALGRIASAGDGAPALLVAMLGGTDEAQQQAAATKVKDVVRPDAVGQVCALVPRLPEAAKIQVLAALSTYPRERVLPTVLEAAKSDSAPVRMAAIKALETVGDVSAVTVLAETAAKAKGVEQAAARSALGLLQGRAVDDKLIAMFSERPSEELEAELLLAVAERRIYIAKPIVAAAVRSPSARVRTHALRSLRSIGTPSDIPAVLDLVVTSDDGPDRAEAEAAAAALAQKIGNPDARSAFVKTRLSAAKDAAARVRLLGVLALIGDSSSLPLVRSALGDTNPEVYDAAVRALAAWRTAAAREDLVRLARDSRNETHRLLAIQALVRAIGLEKHRDPAAAVADLRSAAAFSWRPEEQRLVLGALAQFPCPDALELAAGFLREPSVKPEAEAAIEKINQKLK